MYLQNSTEWYTGCLDILEILINVDNELGNDKVRKETVMYANNDIYLTFILF